MSKKIPEQRRRRHEAILAALEPDGKSQYATAKEHGIDRAYLQRLVAEATRDPEAALEEAEAEVEFRRRVMESLR